MKSAMKKVLDKTLYFGKTGICPFNKLAFGDDNFAPVSVYYSGSTSVPNINVKQVILEEDHLPRLTHTSISLPPLTLSCVQVNQLCYLIG